MARRRSRKKKLPEAPVKVTIESLAHDGRGVTHVDGKVVFIDPAETISQGVTYYRIKYWEFDSKIGVVKV